MHEQRTHEGHDADDRVMTGDGSADRGAEADHDSAGRRRGDDDPRTR